MAKAKILVVDDNQSVCRFVAGVLRPLGYRVRTASNGIEALKAIKDDAPALVLLDLVMPRLNGYQVLKVVQQKKLAPGAHFVLMSSIKEQVVQRVRTLTSVEHTLAKPVTAQQVRELVTGLVPPGEQDPGAGGEDIEFAINGTEAVEQQTEPDAGRQPAAESQSPADGEPQAESQSLDLADGFSGEITSDDAVRTRQDMISLLRDRLDSAVAAGMAARLDDIMSAGNRDRLLETLAEILASVVDDRLVERLLDLVAVHAQVVSTEK